MEERTKQILDAAIELAEEGGFDTVRMRDVAAAAGVALGTFYKRFRSKEDLLVAALTVEMEHLEDRIGKRPPQGADQYERVMDFFNTMTRRFVSRPNLARAVLRAVASGDHDLAGRVGEYHERSGNLVLEALVAGSVAGERDREVAAVLQQVWFASMVGWSGGIIGLDSALRQVAVAARLILRPELA